jgi:hypothetical protein
MSSKRPAEDQLETDTTKAAPRTASDDDTPARRQSQSEFERWFEHEGTSSGDGGGSLHRESLAVL